ncbi:hypothetical protein PCJ53_29690, partial [Klebsiella pneumoniae]|nr:hypothetical protein [Klebsiella pneumoniae]
IILTSIDISAALRRRGHGKRGHHGKQKREKDDEGARCAPNGRLPAVSARTIAISKTAHCRFYTFGEGMKMPPSNPKKPHYC